MHWEVLDVLSSSKAQQGFKLDRYGVLSTEPEVMAELKRSEVDECCEKIISCGLCHPSSLENACLLCPGPSLLVSLSTYATMTGL
ncbi:predicted protein [Sclerotinia sclerotiorum 1980 UF-70]|uniref:Uncharacterized protein n=1 Tax=Sclerotinia sclerotiorum (strain ATCC 18683 / 1980 / Ss-1) TaxID=665079 RepID=A7ES48_SCLS1|nr:predicted protein [Sclerotinia sclerotiorum 1980 UF-70]EDN92290.1 predicted protein [Sclerotinia sclerotiorum 1980 UF-70]